MLLNRREFFQVGSLALVGGYLLLHKPKIALAQIETCRDCLPKQLYSSYSIDDGGTNQTGGVLSVNLQSFESNIRWLPEWVYRIFPFLE